MTDRCGLRIQDAHPGDAQEIATVHVRAWQTAYAALLDPHWLASLSVTQRERQWREALEQGRPRVLLARRGEEAAGWIAFGASRDKDAPARTGEVWAFYVDPGAWRRGVGRALWHAGREQLIGSGMTSATLWVIGDNAPAQRFYERMGFSAQPQTLRTFELGGRELRELRWATALRDACRPAGLDAGSRPSPGPP